MSTRYNTGNPIESTDVRDMSDNAKNFDEFSNSMSDSFTDRFGVDRQTMEGAVRKAGFRPASFDFLTGGSLVSVDRNKAVFNPAPPGDNNWYAWQGALPKIISPNSTPSTSGGLGDNAWKPVTNNILAPTVMESIRRSYAEAGYNVVGTFRAGFAYVNANDVGIDEATGKGYTGHAGPVAAGTDPTSGGFVDRSNMLLRSTYFIADITPEQYGADGTVEGDTSALLKCMDVARQVPTRITLSRMYKANQPLACYYVQTHNTAFTLRAKHSNCGVEWVGPVSATPAYIIDVHGYNLQIIGGVRVRENSGATAVNTAIRVCGEGVIVEKPVVRGRFKRGVLAIACLKGSKINDPDVQLMPSGTPAASCEGVGVSVVSCVNFTIHKGVSNSTECPFTTGDLYETANALKPPSMTETIAWGCEGVDIISMKSVVSKRGPIFSGLEINSFGCTWDLIYDNFVAFEGLFLKSIGSWFGAITSTPASAKVFGIIGAGGSYITFDGNTVSMGAAADAVTPSTISDTFAYPYSSFTNNTVEKMRCLVSGANQITAVGNTPTIGGTPDIELTSSSANNVFIPARRKSRLSEGLLLGKDASDGDGKLQIRANSGERFFNCLTAVGNVLSTCPGGLEVLTVSPSTNAVLFVGAMTSNNRSINARGTVNASGSDYAEYMKKAPNCGVISAGAIVGITANAELTDKFDDAVAFAVKSTSPSIVGGDTWSNSLEFPEFTGGDSPVMPATPIQRHGQSDDDYKSTVAAEEKEYRSKLALYEAAVDSHEQAAADYYVKLEHLRAPYDRVAFSGQVPCNVYSAEPGDYIVPVRNADGSIAGQAIKAPSFDQYRLSVGQVWKVLDDGRCWIAVKIA